MPTPTLNPKITAAGLALFPAVTEPGFHVELTHVALGTGKYTPAVNGSGQATQTALTAEVARYPITSGTNPSPRQVQIGLTITDTDPNGNSPNGLGIGEIGFYAGTTLFAIWSQPTDPLFIKSTAFDVPIAYTLDVSILPASSVTVTVNAGLIGLSSLILQHEAKEDPHPQYQFDSGTRMPFAQPFAPVGWTQDISENADNRMLRVVKTAGGGVAGTHSPILNDVVPSHTHSFTTGGQSASHTHSINDPGHTHPGGESTIQNLIGGSSGAFVRLNYQAVSNTGSRTTGITINNASTDHTHSGSTNTGSAPTNWAPRYIDMLICIKD